MPFPPIRLTDAELDAVMSAARPLAVEMRDPFLRAVATALEGSKVIGPGVVARTCAELQRQFFDPPRSAIPAPDSGPVGHRSRREARWLVILGGATPTTRLPGAG